MDAASMQSARDVRTQAAAWLERRQRPGWSEADQTEFDAWLAQSLANRTAFWRVNDAWARADRLRALGHPIQPEKTTEPRSPMPLFLKFAAGIAIVAVMSAGYLAYSAKASERSYSTDIGGRELITFVDGTRIELNTDTVLRTRMTTRERTVWLDKGEAYFRVKHDPAHPFIVYAGVGRVTDLGTAFLVRRSAGSLKVALLEGRVRLGEASGDGASRSALLRPGDEATTTGRSIVVKHEAKDALENETSWRHGMLAFKYTPLSAAVAEFNRYNRQKLVIADPAVARLTIYGTFPTDDVEAFVDVTKHVLRLHVKNSGDDIVISR